MDKFEKTRFGRIHYQVWGEGEPLVLLHGNGGSSHEFARNGEALARSFKVIAWDMPGQGDSDALAAHMGIGDYSDALAELLTAIGVERAIIGGSSVGAVIAADFAARHASLISKALLIELASRAESWWAAHWEMVEAMFSIPTQDAQTVAKRFVAPATDEIVKRWNIDRNKAGGHSMMDVMWAGRDYDLEAILPRVKAPALLVFGDKSPVLERATEFRDLLPNASLVVLQDAGHFPMTDVPDAFERAISQFATA